MLQQSKLLWYLHWACVVLACVIVVTAPLRLAAQTPTPGPGDLILPNEKPPATATPKPEPRFEIGRFSTSPDQPRINEAFDLHLEIINVGAGPAIGWTIKNETCLPIALTSTVPNSIITDGPCIIPLPTIDPGQGGRVTLNLRAISLDESEEQSVKLQLKLLCPPQSGQTCDRDLNLTIFFLPARDIAEATPTLVRPFPKPDILVQRTWTAKARSTVEELLTPVPVVINSVPVLPMVVGGPEFELVVELRNQGSVEATNIFLDFCAGNSKFNPVGSSCQKYVPANLSPGSNAIASQTLAFKNDQTNMRDRGESVTLTITYDFWYVEQWVQETVTHTVYLYPQFYPAVTPVPAPQTPYLIVNTAVLNIRQGPGTNYLVVGVAYQNERFAITGKHDDWWQIDFRGVTAWAAAYYAIAWGGERVPQASNIPPPPPKKPPDPDPLGANAANPTLVASSVDPSPGGETLSMPAADQTRVSEFVFVNEAGDGGEKANAPFNTVSSEALVVVERYKTIPERVVGDSLFTLELALRNTGQTTAQQLVLRWPSAQVVPLGAGTTRWLDDLAPGGVVIVTGQFLLVDQTLENFIQLPLEVLYTDASGQLVSHVEQLTLLQQRPGGVLSLAPARDERPLWLRLLLGLLGLGAEPQ